MTRFAMRPVYVGLALVLAFTIGCGGGSTGGTSGPDAPIDLIVQQVLPTNHQEVETDLSDVDGVITVRFSERLAKGTVLDDNNRFNKLSSDVNILDSAFARVPGEPTITGDRKNVLTFVPSGGVLPNGQYTVTVTRDVTNYAGGRLNNGLYDFHSAFTVGPDTYSPVIRNTYPAPNQTEVAKDSTVSVVFNESLNPATVTNATFTVVDGGTNPPTPINGTVKVVRDNFEVVFTPDPTSPMPPNTTIVVTILGGASGVTDQVGNPFEGDPATPGSYQFQFSTVTEPPPPNNPLPIDVITPDAGVYISTNDSIEVLHELPYFNTAPDLAGWGNGNPIPNSKTHIGRPTEIVVMATSKVSDGHTWFFVVDEANRNVAVVGTRDSKVVHRFKNLATPRGLGTSTFFDGGLTLYISNYGSNTLTALDLSQTTPGAAFADSFLKGVDDPSNLHRLDIAVGQGPIGVARAPDQNEVFVVNSLDSTCTLVDSAQFKVIKSFSVGSNPYEIAVTPTFNIGNFAFITNQGTGPDDGSVSLFWGGPGALGARAAPYDIESHLTGFKTPKGVTWGYATDPANIWVAESGGDQVTRLTLQVVGGGFTGNILPATTAQVKVGKNPNDVTLEPLFPGGFGALPQCVITADRGDSQLSFVDAQQPSRPTFALHLPGAAFVNSILDQ